MITNMQAPTYTHYKLYRFSEYDSWKLMGKLNDKWQTIFSHVEDTPYFEEVCKPYCDITKIARITRIK